MTTTDQQLLRWMSRAAGKTAVAAVAAAVLRAFGTVSGAYSNAVARIGCVVPVNHGRSGSRRMCGLLRCKTTQPSPPWCRASEAAGSRCCGVRRPWPSNQRPRPGSPASLQRQHASAAQAAARSPHGHSGPIARTPTRSRSLSGPAGCAGPGMRPTPGCARGRRGPGSGPVGYCSGQQHPGAGQHNT